MLAETVAHTDGQMLRILKYRYCCVAKRCKVDSREQHLPSMLAHYTQENQEPVQNNDGSGEIGLSVSTLH